MLEGAHCLVAGGTGFLGSNLVDRLLHEGARVRSTQHERPPPIEHSRVEYVPADLTVPDDCRRAVRGVDYVFLCAANTSGAAVMRENPLVHVTPNVVMNAQLLEAAYEAQVKRFLFISSSAAYPPTGARPVREEEMFDGDPYEAYYSVGWMKRYAEILCRIYAEKLKTPMPTVVIRPSNVYGPYDDFDPRTSHVTAALIRKVVERQSPIEVWGTGEDVRDLIYVDDFIDGLLKVFVGSDQGAINIAAGGGHTVREVLEILLELDDYGDAEIRVDPSKPTTIPVRLVDTTLAKREFGWEPRVSLRDGLARTIRWYRESRA